MAGTLTQGFIKLLYVEDNDLDQRAFVDLVREKVLPYELTVADTLSEARSRLANSQFDVIVADYHLPDGNCTGLFGETKETPLLLLTGTLEENLALRTLEHGADDYLPKDVQYRYLEILPFAIEKTLRRKLLRDREQQLTRKLRESEERFRTLTEVSTQVVWVCQPNGDLAVDSPSWHAFTGRGVEQWTDRNWLDAIHPDDRQTVADAWRSALKHVQPYTGEYRLMHSSGTYRHMRARAVPVLNIDGTVREWIGTLTDITEAKRADVARNTLAAIITSSDDAIIGLTLDGVITSWNRGAELIFGYPATEMIGQSVLLLVPPDIQKEEQQILDAIRQGEKIEHYESLRQTKTGRNIDVSISASPILNDTGAIVGVSKIARDITEQKRAERALVQAKEALDRVNEQLEQKVEERTAKLQETIGELEHFSYSITHDMRAPLRAMRSFADILMEECGPALQPTHRDYLKHIAAAADRMDHLIVDTLDYSKAIRQKLPLEKVDLEGLLREIIQTYPDFQRPNATVNIIGSIPAVLANQAGLTQCCSNLLDNAIKFVRPGQVPEVQISAISKHGVVRLRFEDKGIGIDEQYHDQIFGMFQRLSKEYEGTGIGLALVRKVAERMGGHAGVESHQGIGSRFWLEFKKAA